MNPTGRNKGGRRLDSKTVERTERDVSPSKTISIHVCLMGERTVRLSGKGKGNEGEGRKLHQLFLPLINPVRFVLG